MKIFSRTPFPDQRKTHCLSMRWITPNSFAEKPPLSRNTRIFPFKTRSVDSDCSSLSASLGRTFDKFRLFPQVEHSSLSSKLLFDQRPEMSRGFLRSPHSYSSGRGPKTPASFIPFLRVPRRRNNESLKVSCGTCADVRSSYHVDFTEALRVIAPACH